MAVPDFIRVDPVTTSGPTRTVMHSSHVSRSSAGGSEQDTSAVRAPSVCARDSAARTNGRGPAGGDAHDDVVRPDLARVHLADAGIHIVLGAFDRANERGKSARDDTDDHLGRSAEGRRALRGVEHPSRPLVPAPTYIRRPPARNAASMRSIVLAISRRARATAAGTVASSAPMRSTMSSAEAVSMVALRGLRRSVRRASRKSSATQL